MKNKEIKSIRTKLGIQLTTNQISAIIKIVNKKTPCNFLIFGLGKDTPLWIKINKKGRTVFLEDLKQWFIRIKDKNPSSEAYLIKYSTKMQDWKKLSKNPNKLIIKLPKKILDTKWDVILIDSPKGWKKDQPGRMKSIYMASRLIAKKGDIFVHDCHREIEAFYSDKFLLKKNLITAIGSLRHYNIK